MFALLSRYDKGELALILGLVGLILTAPLTAYVVWPEFRTLTAVSATRDTLKAATNVDSDLGGRLNTLRDDVRTLEQRLHGDMASLPPKEVEAYIIGRLQAISWRNGVELVGVEPDSGETIETFREMLFTVRLAGEYFDLYAWLRDLGNELGFVVIKQYRMSPIDRQERTPRLAAELTIASYRAAAL